VRVTPNYCFDSKCLNSENLYRIGYVIGFIGTDGVKVEDLTRTSVGRPGHDPDTLGVFPERPATSLGVQICWPDNEECSPTSTEVLSRLNWWLDNWLDQGSVQGQVTIQFRKTDGKGFELRLGTS
jgi:hypothetical protein